jgi:hypothetical protein
MYEPEGLISIFPDPLKRFVKAPVPVAVILISRPDSVAKFAIVRALTPEKVTVVEYPRKVLEILVISSVFVPPADIDPLP